MFDLKNLYSQMWIDSIDKFKNNNCELDPLINVQSDMRRGITVLSYLDNSVVENISNFLDELKIIEPEQYYYPRSELHLTILSVISCITGFKLSSINVEAYSSIFQETIRNIDRFKINFKGITVSPSCILIQGFPDSEQLNHLRDSLRASFKASKLESTIDSRYKLSTAHTTVVRCMAPFKNNNELMAVLSKYRDYDFGTLEINSLELVFNNWYQNSSVTKNLSSSKLKPSEIYV
ncbi:2'-5' RNA ligase family protein [Pseudoalteromonas sp. NCIMB_1079]|uniref:2'-5' RNA ligase family protein n=1 Tax=Pseudoalteromonas TaxID=53246 RepID=UPI00339CC408